MNASTGVIEEEASSKVPLLDAKENKNNNNNNNVTPSITSTADVSRDNYDDDNHHHQNAREPPHYYTTHPDYRHIPEARDLKWTDSYFHSSENNDNNDNDNDIVAVFDLDYDAMEAFHVQFGFVCLGLSILIPPVFVISTMICLMPCFLKSNIQWSIRATHVAITRDGIRFVTAKHPSCWGFPCTDVGKHSKTVPFDKITDCDVTEPAGNACLCCVPRVLHTVNIDTASSSQEFHELRIQGIIEPYKFKKLVWAMKRQQHRQQQQQLSPSSTPCNALQMMDRGSAGDVSTVIGNNNNNDNNKNNNEEVTILLRQIRDELRRNTSTMEKVVKASKMATNNNADNSNDKLTKKEKLLPSLLPSKTDDDDDADAPDTKLSPQPSASTITTDDNDDKKITA